MVFDRPGSRVNIGAQFTTLIPQNTFDANGNGRIDDVNELFGGTERGVGYQELGAFDSNKDGVVNGLDSDFGRLYFLSPLMEYGDESLRER